MYAFNKATLTYYTRVKDMFFVTVLSDNFTVQLHNKIGVRKSNGVANYVSVQMFKQ